MALFDFLRSLCRPFRRRDRAAEHAPPRLHHYALVHVVLRQIALSHPLETFAALVGESKQEFFEQLVRSVDDAIGEQGEELDFAARDLRCHHMRVNDCPCAVIQMPDPRGITEAHLVGLVVPLAEERIDRQAAEPEPEGRYFTLERGAGRSGESRTVLCEWTADAHLNYGDGPSPTAAAFCRALEPHVK